MARSKPNKSLKSPNKQQNKEQNKTNKTKQNNTKCKNTHNEDKHENNRNRRKKRTNREKRYTSRKIRTKPGNIPYYESEKIHRQINRNDRHKQQFDEDGKVIDSSDDGFQQPLDEDAQGNVLTEEELALIKMNDSHRTPNKQDAKPAAETEDQ
jgi:hypothetical protein